MKNYHKFLLTFILVMLVLSPLASAFFPKSHYAVLEKSLKTPQDTQLYQACNNNKSLCMAGDMLTDWTVFFYYTKFINYKISHNPSFCTSLIDEANNEEELACAIGSRAHSGADLTSHTVMVPGAIVSTLIPNTIIHPFAEQKLDLWVEEQNPE